MKRVVLSLGSNLSERRVFIAKAASAVGEKVGRVLRSSSVRESESWGFSSSPFLNQVLEVETALTPEQVLQATQQIERSLGRTEKSGRDENGQPVYHDRTIDIDLLWFEGESRCSDKLTLPHPHIAQREFILVLLIELFDNQIVAPFKESFVRMLETLQNQSEKNEL